ncbi:MAG TPA: hypothetical protein PLO37_15655 [Candidatus Hydrogenedentes bacterium]|nr:hypothetical protein [Candidatus Hydrogenedentota bacterium]HPG68282.1 hypothetical protein [Candidatus Hydrogenedentota bacterium]
MAKLEEAVQTASEVDQEVLRMLMADAKYEIAKRKIAAEMLSFTESRVIGLRQENRKSSPSQAATYDALSSIQDVPFAWLSAEDRVRALTLATELEKDLAGLDFGLTSAAASAKEDDSSPGASVDDAISMINGALEEAQSEDLSLIENAKTNGVIREALKKCEAAREVLMAQSPDLAGSARRRWEAGMLHLSKAAETLRERQTLKYALWAEGVYRESDPTNVAQSLSDKETVALYRRLSEVNISLVSEPSLAREITKRLYELYDSLGAGESRERVRYEAIINLDKRKSLDDF